MPASGDAHKIVGDDDISSAEAEWADLPFELAKQIVKQIDYYFSDENLATDRHLIKLIKSHGGKNNPVSLEHICSWNKMRIYKYDLVIKAVKDCANVDLINENGKWFVMRKAPFALLDPVTGEETNPNKKRSKKKPTGFEQYYADAPITPAAFAEEQALYDPTIAFPDRIETAIQRYAQKRRFGQNPLLVFNKWMRYGGIDCSQKMFTGGIDQAMLEDKTKDEITAITAANFVGVDKYEPDAQWAVDFESVAKGFLSSEAPAIWDFQTQNQIQECTNILRNFYNYLLHHSVCPEHTESILAARKVCDLADRELFSCHTVLISLPGNFNTACSTLFDGEASNKHTEKPAWLADDDQTVLNLGMDKVTATRVFKFGIAAHASDDDLAGEDALEVQHRILSQRIIALEENIGLEVVDIVPAHPEHDALHATKHGLGKGQALGKLICRSWKAPSFDYFDLHPADSQDSRTSAEGAQAYEFWLEQHILDSCFIGMKIEGTVATLSSGLRFLDKMTAVRCSFYTVLVNDLVSVAEKWKEPVEVTREEWLEKMKQKEEWRKTLASTAEIDDVDSMDKGRVNEDMTRPEVEFVKVEGFDYGNAQQSKKEDEGVAGLVEEEVD